MLYCLFIYRFLKTSLLLIVIAAGSLEGTKDQNHGNLNEPKLLVGQSNCNASTTDALSLGASTTMSKATSVLLESQESVVRSAADSLTLPIEYVSVGQHVVRLGLGTPQKLLFFRIATLVDVSWTQCEPCTICYPQMEPIYNPSNSSTYGIVLTGSQTCNELLNYSTGGGWWIDECKFGYEDNANAAIDGDYGTDVLSVNDKALIERFVFGCGRANYLPDNGKVAGYLGLGTGPKSFLSTTADKYNETFSYCLPHDENSSGFLSFGMPAASKSAQFVPFEPSFRTNYGIDLVGVSVGGKLIGAPYWTTSIVLDTTSMVTRFSAEIYRSLRNEFRKRMSNYSMLQDIVSPDFDSCYDLSGHQNVSIPPIEFRLSKRVVLPLPPSRILYAWNSTISCFPFSVKKHFEDGVFGTFHQSAFEIIYDNPNKRIGFVRDACSTNRSLHTVGASKAPVTLPIVVASSVAKVATTNIILAVLIYGGAVTLY